MCRGNARNTTYRPQQHAEKIRSTHVRMDDVDLTLLRMAGNASQLVRWPAMQIRLEHLQVVADQLLCNPGPRAADDGDVMTACTQSTSRFQTRDHRPVHGGTGDDFHNPHRLLLLGGAFILR
jgi:hypothetical protein